MVNVKDYQKCPKCGADMVLRRNRKLGITFLGCSQYDKTGCTGKAADPNLAEAKEKTATKKAATPPIV